MCLLNIRCKCAYQILDINVLIKILRNPFPGFSFAIDLEPLPIAYRRALVIPTNNQSS